MIQPNPKALGALRKAGVDIRGFVPHRVGHHLLSKDTALQQYYFRICPKANASLSANRTEDGLVKEVRKMLAEAAARDKEEDLRHGKDGKEEALPRELRSKGARLAKIRELQREMTAEKEAARVRQAEKITIREAEEAVQGSRKRERKPTPPDKIALDEAKVNLTDPESRIMKSASGFVQGYNAQAVVTADQIIVAAELTQEANDQKQLEPMLVAVEASLGAIGHEGGFGTAPVDSLTRR